MCVCVCKREKERGDSHRPRGRGVGWDAELKGSEERRGGWSVMWSLFPVWLAGLHLSPNVGGLNCFPYRGDRSEAWYAQNCLEPLPL